MILDDIIAKQKTRIENEKKEKNIETLKQEVLSLPSSKNFFFENSLKSKDFSFICEIKRLIRSSADMETCPKLANWPSAV